MCIFILSSKLHFVAESTNHCIWLEGNYQAKVLFETAQWPQSKDKDETNLIQQWTHARQQRFFDLLGKRKRFCTPEIAHLNL